MSENENGPGGDWGQITPEMVQIDLLRAKESVRAQAIAGFREAGVDVSAEMLDRKLAPVFARWDREAELALLRMQSASDRRRALTVVN